MAYYDFLNFLFAPLLNLPPLLAVLGISFLVSIIIILVTKYTTDQAMMKRLKEEIKEHQKQVKELRNNPTKAMEVQKKAMEANMKYMSHSLRPTIITLIPIIIIFGWMSSTFAYESIKPQQEFTLTAFFSESANGEAELIASEGVAVVGIKKVKIEAADGNTPKKAEWVLKGSEGEHLLEIVYNGEKHQKNVLITNSHKYIEPIKKTEGTINSIQINYKKLIILPIGYKDWFGWLGTYIISSIILTMVLRKLLKVY